MQHRSTLNIEISQTHGRMEKNQKIKNKEVRVLTLGKLGSIFVVWREDGKPKPRSFKIDLVVSICYLLNYGA